MESVGKAFNRRKFVSIGLFLAITILIITGILIQVLENFEEGFVIHFSTAVHVLVGTLFAVLSILHLIINWRAMKSYINTKNIGISKEAVWAGIATLMLVILGFVVSYEHL